jgi:Transglutaminase-like superfamily
VRSLLFEAYANLIRFEFYNTRKDFAGLYRVVRQRPLGSTQHPTDVLEHVSAAVDMACIWYPKTVLCLQRSFALAYMLKRHGIRAELVIGAQHLPFKAHAWVESGGRVVNDKPYLQEIYEVLDRC